MAKSLEQSPLAIVAMGTKFPGRGTTSGFWRDMVEGVDTSSDIPETHWLARDHYDPDPNAPDKTYSSRGAFIPAFPFDPVEFGTPPNVIETTDTVQLLALYVAKQVLADAQPLQGPPVDLERTSVVLGVAAGTELIGDMASRLNRPIWIKAMREEGLARSDAEAIADRISSHYTEWRESTFPGLLGNVVAGRIANRFDLGGTNFTADAACASSLAAIRHAAQELWLGESDMVLAGGADALNNIFMFMCFSKTPAMSASGQCRPFSDDADGTLMGEGCGIFALRRLEDAERDGNTIHAVITGIGASSDGRGSSVYAPRADGQARAIRRALSQADISPRTVELMEAHGTGTRAGDAAEFAGLKEVFGAADGGAGQWCALGSIKSQIGHTKSAAGAASLAKIASALHHKVLPPTINVRVPNPKLGIEGSPFYLNTEARPWIRGADHPRRASISSFGFGGTNFHMTLEEASGSAPRPAKYRTAPTELFLASSSSPAGLVARAGEIAAACRRDEDLPYHAKASQAAFDVAEPHRLALVTGSREELGQLVERLGPRIEAGKPFSAGNAVYAAGPSSAAADMTAFLFAGQGSQYIGMGADLAMAFGGARVSWDRAVDDPGLAGVRLHDLAFPPPAFTEEERARQESDLTRTENAQPAIGLVALGQLNLLRDLGLRANCVMGHSFGEVMALHAAGALDAPAAIRLARARGQAMAQAAGSTPGGMLVVFAERGVVDRYLAEQSSRLVLANDNAPDQVVLSGPVEVIEKAEKELSGRGLRVRRLSVSTAFHSPLVASAVADLEAAIKAAGLGAPELKVYANATGEAYPHDEAAARDLLSRQLTAAVRFRETIDRMYRDGVRTFVEVGPSAVLSGLVGSILHDRPHLAVALDQRRLHGVTALQQALAKLATAGHAINFDALWAEAPATAPRPEPKPHEVMLNGANYAKPYPPRDGTGAPPVFSDGLTLSELRAAAAQVSNGSGPASGEPSNPIPQLAVHDADAPACERATEQGAAAAVLPEANESEHGDEMDPKARRHGREMHDNLNAAHRHYVDAMSESHIAFLRASEACFGQLNQNGSTAETCGVQDRPSSVEGELSKASPSGTCAKSTESASEDLPADLPAESLARPEIVTPIQAELRAETGPTVTEKTPDAIAGPPASNGAALSAAAETVRAVVAEKTGYPVDMLDLGMDLEAELGIDSIKQVEILSALRERLPEMPEIEPARLAELRTLQLIAEAIVAEAPAPVQETVSKAPAPRAPAAAAEKSVAAAPASNGSALAAAAETVRAVVAEKTGYPVDMLDLGMDLEAELGIDSIKQVEILSALRERLPEMPEIEPARLAELRTLQLIAEAIVAEAPASAPTQETVNEAPAPRAPVPAAQEPAAAAPTSNGAALSAAAETVRAVVAEKTGYPVDMLDLGMDLEAELGIDSIKQVEILSALRERLPEMPEIEPARLAELRTLQLIAEAIVDEAPASAPTQETVSEAPAPRAPVPAVQEQATAAPASNGSALAAAAETVRAVVAEKTGYPIDMLDLGMDLEAELGIDSIKQVEILSALRERLPEMPEIEPARLAELRTLQLIAEAIVDEAPVSASTQEVVNEAPATLVPNLSLRSIEAESAARDLCRQAVCLDEVTEDAAPNLLKKGDRIQITAEARALAYAIADALNAQQFNAEVVEKPAEDADVVIATSGLADDFGTPALYRSALAAARKTAERMSLNGGCFVFLQDCGGDFGRTNRNLDIAARGGLTGLAKTAAREWPNAELRLIDIERNGEPVQDTARRVVRELLRGSDRLEIGLPHDGRRLTPSAKPVAYGDSSLDLPDGANIVVSGGGRGITAQVIRRLARLGNLRFLILGRSELIDWPADIDPKVNEHQLRSVLAENALQTGRAVTPREVAAEARQLGNAREVTQTLAAVQAAGSEATYVAVDVTDPADVAAAVAAFRDRHGPVTGVIHGAGQLADKLIKDKTDEQLERVMAPKVDGFRSLWSAVEGDDPSFVALFSSFAGHSGNPGQADYAMANEVLNRFAWSLRQLRPQMRVMSVNWGPWLDGMVNEGLRAQFAERGVPFIPTELGVEAFVAELFHGSLDNPEVVFAGEPVPMAARVDTQAAIKGGCRKKAAASLRQPLN